MEIGPFASAMNKANVLSVKNVGLQRMPRALSQQPARIRNGKCRGGRDANFIAHALGLRCRG